MATIHGNANELLANWTAKGLVAPKASAPIQVSDDSDEKDFQADVIAWAKRQGWKVFHVHDARKSEAGWPDLVFVRERIIFAELKTVTGTTTADQDTWLEALRGAKAEVYVWRPSDWALIERTLR